MPPLVNALVLWIAATGLTATAWPTRTWSARARIVTLGTLAVVLFVSAGLQPIRPIGYRIAIVVALPILAMKLLDLHVAAAWWRTRSFRSWLWYLFVPFVLVLRRYEEEPPRPRSAALRLLARGALEVTAGVFLLRWANSAEIESFWLLHTIKLMGAYLVAFDGGMVCLTALLRLSGLNVLDFSRHPIVARTPADFWRRYNRPTTQYLHNDVYKPVGGLRHPYRGIAVVFLVSGVLHEYVAYMLIGHATGYQFAFFSLHGLAVMATRKVRLKGAKAVLGAVATFLFLVASSVLFFASVDAIDKPGWYYLGGGLLR